MLPHLLRTFVCIIPQCRCRVGTVKNVDKAEPSRRTRLQSRIQEPIKLNRKCRRVGRGCSKLGRSGYGRTISKGKALARSRYWKPATSWVTAPCVSQSDQYNGCREHSLQVLCMHAAICSRMVST